MSNPLTFVKHYVLDLAARCQVCDQYYNHCLTYATETPYSHHLERMLPASHLQRDSRWHILGERTVTSFIVTVVLQGVIVSVDVLTCAVFEKSLPTMALNFKGTEVAPWQQCLLYLRIGAQGGPGYMHRPNSAIQKNLISCHVPYAHLQGDPKWPKHLKESKLL